MSTDIRHSSLIQWLLSLALAFQGLPLSLAQASEPQSVQQTHTTFPSLIPSHLGTVAEEWGPPDAQPNRFVIHVQDLHSDATVQSRVSELLDHVHESQGVDLITLEGAEGVVETQLFAAFPNPAIRRNWLSRSRAISVRGA